MQCSTALQIGQAEVESHWLVGPENWAQLMEQLSGSIDLEASARRTGALVRRREVKSPADLLRLALGYAVCDCSLRQLGIRCVLWELGCLSKTALRKRLRCARRWLGTLVVTFLELRRLRLLHREGVRLRLVDATAIRQPGAKGTGWRMHLGLDLGEACLTGVEVTDAHGAETLARFPVQPGEIQVADRGYAYDRGLGPILAQGGRLVVRINWRNLRLQEEDGQRFDLPAWLRTLDATASPQQERTVWLATDQGRFALRLVICRLPPDKAEQARRRARQIARKKKHQVDPRTLLAAGFVLLLTNLPTNTWSTADVLALYRIRWQVEMLIKRYKSLLAFDGLRAQDPDLAQTYLLGKVLGVFLLEEMEGRIRACAPPDWDVPGRPVSPWRLLSLCQDALKILVRGSLTEAAIINALPRLRRFLADEPRRRLSQRACAHALLHTLSSC